MKNIFLSIIFLFSSFLTLSVKGTKNEFLNNCYKGYNTYTVIEEAETEKYEFSVIIGEINKEVSYSVLFISNNAKEYELKFKDNKNNEYNISKNSRGDILKYNILIDEKITLEIQTHSTITYSVTINNYNYDEYIDKYNSTIIQGENLGLEQTLLTKTNVLSYIGVLLIIFSSIIIISVLILVIAFKKQKGLFNQEKFDEEFKQEHEVKKSIQDYIQNNVNNNDLIIEETIVEEENNNKEVYNKVKDYEEEQRDISIILKEKGFNINYHELETEEKNIIMVELMKMKNTKEITDEEYHTEIIKLWMK